MSEVMIILGSAPDKEIAIKCTEILKKFGIGYEVAVASAHRTPERVKEIVEKSNAKVFIAIAGLAAALPGVVAAHTTKPVIGVPVSGKVPLDSLLSIVQMPTGIPVACVGVDNSENAALLAAEILALQNEEISKKLALYRQELEKKVEESAKLEKL
ncbi:MAG: 5-(carboxyamino)imidazole ribonucleotide mutase [Candidatus Thermoplasmatota archaeon]|nr:5-(carboxyamino)imidazole ribonucleotide mutase [Candidatus Thermoplasmatota archaeon]